MHHASYSKHSNFLVLMMWPHVTTSSCDQRFKRLKLCTLVVKGYSVWSKHKTFILFHASIISSVQQTHLIQCQKTTKDWCPALSVLACYKLTDLFQKLTGFWRLLFQSFACSQSGPKCQNWHFMQLLLIYHFISNRGDRPLDYFQAKVTVTEI